MGASCKGMLHNDPKSKIQNPRNPAEKVWILDFGYGKFWILESGFWILGGSRGCTTRQFSDGALGSDALVRLWGAMRNQPYLIRLGKGWRQQFFHVFLDFTCRFGLFMSGGPSLAASLRVTKTNCI